MVGGGLVRAPQIISTARPFNPLLTDAVTAPFCQNVVTALNQNNRFTYPTPHVPSTTASAAVSSDFYLLCNTSGEQQRLLPLTVDTYEWNLCLKVMLFFQTVQLSVIGTAWTKRKEILVWLRLTMELFKNVGDCHSSFEASLSFSYFSVAFFESSWKSIKKQSLKIVINS